MNTRTKIITIILVIAISCYFLFNDQTAPISVSEDSAAPTLISDSEIELSTDMAILLVPEETAKTTPNDSPEQEEQDSRLNSQFSGIAKQSDEAKVFLEEAGVLPSDLAAEAYLEFDLEALRSLEVGDTFDLEIPQTLETFSTEVTQTQAFENGDKSVFGRLVGSDGEFHNSVMTVGEDALYGQITTPSGNYVFETKGKHGWLAAKRDLYRSHVELEAVRETNEGSRGVVLTEPQNN